MDTRGYTLFETDLGTCAVAWGETALTGVLLPEADIAALRAHLRRRFAEADETPPPDFVRAACARIGALIKGAPEDLRDVPLDLARVPKFERAVYQLLRQIGPGETTTYGALARQLDQPDAAQAIGRAMGRNPFVIVVPCHRVLAANGRIGGFSAPGGIATKRRLLAIEARHAPRDATAPGLFDPGIA